MKGDFTRFTFEPKKHYTSVRMQQGRVQLDSDWNEQADIQTHLTQSVAKDMIGACGTQKQDGGFRIELTTNKKDFLITPGNIYVDGILCELEQEINYTNQPDYPNPGLTKQSDNSEQLELNLQQKKFYLAYLDVWERHITSIEDTNIREVGLNGPDTTTRTKTIWQVKLLELDNNTWETSQKWKELIKERDVSIKVDDHSDYDSERNWKNELYRVEIHKSGTVGTATFKWSRNNGSLVFPVKEVRENYIQLGVTSRSLSDSFQANQWVEITNDIRELRGEPGTLVRLTGKISGNRVYFSPEKVFNDSSDSETFPQENNLKVRAWDNTSNSVETTTNTPVTLSENGLKLEFAGSAKFKSGDYWLIPTRTVKINGHNIQWPFEEENPLPQAPDGIKHHYCPLALLSLSNDVNTIAIEDLRSTFPTLSNCLDKTGDVMTGTLEIQNNLYVTGEDSKIGIGTKQPQQKLVIDNGKVGIGYNEENQTATLAINGNVGIGTQTPGVKLEVAGKANIADSLCISTNVENNSKNKLSVKGDTYLDGKLEVTQDVYLATKNIESKVGIGTVEPQQKLIIDNLGKVGIGYNEENQTAALAIQDHVGIGTHDPQAKLEVVGDVKIAGSQGNLLVDGNVNIGGEPTESDNGNEQEAKLYVQGLTKISDGDFEVNESALIATADNSKVTIGSDTSNSTTKLAVKGDTKITGKLQIIENDKTVLAVTDNKVGIDTATPQQKLVINNGKVAIGYNEENQTAALAIQDNVGIGTYNPQAKLEVAGNAKISDDLAVAGKVNIGNQSTQNNSEIQLSIQGNTDIKGKVKIGDTPPTSNQEATEAQLYVKGNAYIDGEVYATDINLRGSRLRNSSYFGIIDTQATDTLIVNPDSAYQAIALYNSVGINNGGLAVGELSSLPNGELKVTNSALLATNDGNVGIGTSQVHPNTLLGVKGSTSIGEAYINQAAPTNGLIVQGNVGIGTGSPDSATKLDVAGKVKIKDGVGIGTEAPEQGLAVEGKVDIGSESTQNDQLKLFVQGNTEIRGEFKVTEHALLATTENTQVSIGTSQQPQENNLLGIAGNTTIGSSYANTEPAPPDGLLVEGKTHIGDKPPLDNLEANEAKLYVKGNAYIDGEIYAENIRNTGSRFKNSSGLSIIDTQFADSLIVNPDSEYKAIILYKSVGISSGGLAVGGLSQEELSQLPEGELKVTNSAFLAIKDGNVGIGTDSPDSDTKLDVVGKVKITGGVGIGTTAPESGVRVNGIIETDTVNTKTIIAQDFMQESSQEYKNNITNLSIQESKQILDNLKPVKYSYIKDPSQKLHAGFIAEESHDLFTSADKTMLNSTGIIAILTSVLKEQMYENSDLNRLILQQQREIEQLSIRLRKIEKNQRKLPLGFGFMNMIRNIFT